MVFNSKKDLFSFIYSHKKIGSGATSSVYYDPKRQLVYKISNKVFLEYCGIDKFDISTFKDIKNNTYVFPNEIIYIKDEPVGFVMNYVKGKMLYNIDPLNVNLDMYADAAENAYLDTIKLSDDGICSNDVVFNTMLSEDKIKVIDTNSYVKSSKDLRTILSNNISNINISLKDFLVASLFEEFVESNKQLHEMYDDREANIKAFLVQFRKYLSEYSDRSITTLKEASIALNRRRRNSMYIRLI